MIPVETVIAQIKETLALHLTLDHIEIVDESYLHATHPQRPKDQYHLALTLSSQDLKGKSRVAQHKLIYKILDPFLKSSVHALKIRLLN
jgi:BolA family transcriptional regulator, general stress-responsive regulator